MKPTFIIVGLASKPRFLSKGLASQSVRKCVFGTCTTFISNEGNLKRVSEFIGKRVFASGAIAKPMTVMLRRKLAEIKEGRLRMIVGMKSTKKGEVINREGKVAKIKSRNPHYDATKSNCLTKCCPWSDGYQQNRAKESFAISCANGQLKTRVKITIVSNLAQDCPQLQQIMILLLYIGHKGRVFSPNPKHSTLKCRPKFSFKITTFNLSFKFATKIECQCLGQIYTSKSCLNFSFNILTKLQLRYQDQTTASKSVSCS